MDDPHLTNLDFMWLLLDTTLNNDEVQQRIEQRIALRRCLSQRHDADRDLAVRPAGKAERNVHFPNLGIVGINPGDLHGVEERLHAVVDVESRQGRRE